MSSGALEKWCGVRAVRLDNLVVAHRAVAGDGAGRRWLTVEVNHALIVRLASEFQGFCRDLHDQAIDAFLSATFDAHQPADPIIRRLLTSGRKLDSGNASWANVNNDFARLGMSIKAELDGRYPKRRSLGPRSSIGSTSPAMPSRTTTPRALLNAMPSSL